MKLFSWCRNIHGLQEHILDVVQHMLEKEYRWNIFDDMYKYLELKLSLIKKGLQPFSYKLFLNRNSQLQQNDTVKVTVDVNTLYNPCILGKLRKYSNICCESSQHRKILLMCNQLWVDKSQTCNLYDTSTMLLLNRAMKPQLSRSFLVGSPRLSL